MPHEGGKTSLLTQELNNIKRQLKSGKTRSKNPRDLNAEEIAALTQKRDILIAKMAAQAKERAVNRINSHTAKEVGRIIENQRPTNETVSALGAMFLRGELPACEGQRDAPPARARGPESQHGRVLYFNFLEILAGRRKIVPTAVGIF